MLTGFAWSLFASQTVRAQPVEVALPAGRLADAVAMLSRQAGVTIGAPGGLPPIRVRSVRGRMEAAAALARLLADTGWRAVAVAPGVFRIEAAPQRAPPPHPAPRPTRDDGPPPVVVTANKRLEDAAQSASALAVVDGSTLATLGDEVDTRTVATALTGLTTTNLGTGRDRLFIRGIADSPFDGFGQSSVAVHIDEARITYDAPDPDLRLVDVARVELLKGPQGPLYGTGALGGVYRVVTNKPDLNQGIGTIALGGNQVSGGGAGMALEAMVNLPLAADRLGVRLVGYRFGQGGWIDDLGGPANVNRTTTLGGRIAIRARAGGWTIDLLGLGQFGSVRDSQYVERRHTLTRAARAAEPQDVDLRLIGVTASGRIAGLAATITANSVWQELQATYDASAQAATLGGTAPAMYRDHRLYRVSTAELRLSGARDGIDWLAGGSLLLADTVASGTLVDAGPPLAVLSFHRDVTEAAVFGELTGHPSARVSGTLGLRAFRSTVEDERRERGGTDVETQDRVRFSPSATLAWHPGAGTVVYGRFASALRPGGIQTAAGGTSTTYGSDRVETAELGGRLTLPDDRLHIDVNVFASSWHNVQSDFLGGDGLVTTRNAGNARNYGVDLSGRWQPVRRWTWSGGILAQRARIDATPAPGLPIDRRLPVVPDLSGYAALRYAQDWGKWQVTAVVRASYVGERRLSFDPGLDRESQPVALGALSAGAARDGWTLRMAIDNVLNSRADSFAFGNPFTVAASRQRTPVRPRTLSLSVRRSW